MTATATNATLPQLLDQYRTAASEGKDKGLNGLIRLSYQSMALEGAALTLPQTRDLIQNGQPIPDKPSDDQWRMIDHQKALEQILAMAYQREPINRVALQDIAATLMRQTGEPTYSLLSSFDTRTGELRIDNVLAGRRVLVAAHKLPAALDELFKGVNTRINQLKTLRQIYDLSFETHFQLLTLHPFGAGNGPMARLLMTYIQHYHHLPLSQVYLDNRQAYLTSLESSWSQKTAVPIVNFMHSQLLRMLEEGISRPPDEHDLD